MVLCGKILYHGSSLRLKQRYYVLTAHNWQKLIVDFLENLECSNHKSIGQTGLVHLFPNIVRKEISINQIWANFVGEKRYICHYNYMYLIELESKSVLHIC